MHDYHYYPQAGTVSHKGGGHARSASDVNVPLFLARPQFRVPSLDFVHGIAMETPPRSTELLNSSSLSISSVRNSFFKSYFSFGFEKHFI